MGGEVYGVGIISFSQILFEGLVSLQSHWVLQRVGLGSKVSVFTPKIGCWFEEANLIHAGQTGFKIFWWPLFLHEKHEGILPPERDGRPILFHACQCILKFQKSNSYVKLFSACFDYYV